MSDPYIGQISMFAGNFAPRGWSLCEGQLLAINQNQALFSILGTTYGGDGRTTFALPDLRGRFPLQPGSGPGLPTYRLGEKGGGSTATLTQQELPTHTHTMKPRCSSSGGTAAVPVNNYWAVSDSDDPPKQYSPSHNAQMAEQVTDSTGGGLPLSIQNPYLGINFIIALIGVFPSRN